MHDPIPTGPRAVWRAHHDEIGSYAQAETDRADFAAWRTGKGSRSSSGRTLTTSSIVELLTGYQGIQQITGTEMNAPSSPRGLANSRR